MRSAIKKLPVVDSDNKRVGIVDQKKSTDPLFEQYMELSSVCFLDRLQIVKNMLPPIKAKTAIEMPLYKDAVTAHVKVHVSLLEVKYEEKQS